MKKLSIQQLRAQPIGLIIENYMIMEKIYISVKETIDSEFVTKHAK